MDRLFSKIFQGYQDFREKYVHGHESVMKSLSQGQNPEIMVVSCCDSRVDPALILQCDPGDLFVVRNVANIVPPYEKDGMHHGTSAALEFGVRFLNVKHLILLGHSQCGGIQTFLAQKDGAENDFISNWVSLLPQVQCQSYTVDDYAKQALQNSYENCLSFPWVKEALDKKTLLIHLWFFDIKSGQIHAYSQEDKAYAPLVC